MLVDTHAHLDFGQFDEDRWQTVERAPEWGVEKIVNVGIDERSSRSSIALAQRREEIYAAVGYHPHNAEHFTRETGTMLADLACEGKVKAIGETGLDFYHDHSPRDLQRKAFRHHLRLSEQLQLPVIVHAREATQQALKIIEEEKYEGDGVFHCFAGDLQQAREVANLGFYIGLGGVLTYPNAQRLRRVAEKVPLEHFVLETDAPYLAPQEKRGERNEPAYVKYVAEELARIKDVSFERVGEVTSNNARHLFGI